MCDQGRFTLKTFIVSKKIVITLRFVPQPAGGRTAQLAGDSNTEILHGHIFSPLSSQVFHKENVVVAKQNLHLKASLISRAVQKHANICTLNI